MKETMMLSKKSKFLPQRALRQNRNVRKDLKYNYFPLRSLRNLGVLCGKINLWGHLAASQNI